MIGFAEVFAALHEGKRVRREHWDGGSTMFIQGSQLMFSCRGSEPVDAMPLDWTDMNANDWRIL